MAITRQVWVIAHRWAGLMIAALLIVAGITGAVIPFREPLGFALRPTLSQAAPRYPSEQPLDGIALVERIEAQTGGRMASVPLDVSRDRVTRVSVRAVPGNAALPFDTVWADPYSGKFRLAYRYGFLADGIQNLPLFLYHLHYGVVFGQWGVWTFGVAGLIWTLDCFVGFYLTLPLRRRRGVATGSVPRGWWSRWKPAWKIRTRARGHKLNVDLHRAGGLWLWPLLFVFAWSSVGFNLPSVHRPVMAMFGAAQASVETSPGSALDRPPIDRRAAFRIGRRLLQVEAARRAFDVLGETALDYDSATGTYSLSASASITSANSSGEIAVRYSGRDGHFESFEPARQPNADAVTDWFNAIHTARNFGPAYKIFVSCAGLAVVALSVTGIAIWMKKRSARILGRRTAST